MIQRVIVEICIAVGSVNKTSWVLRYPSAGSWVVKPQAKKDESRSVIDALFGKPPRVFHQRKRFFFAIGIIDGSFEECATRDGEKRFVWLSMEVSIVYVVKEAVSNQPCWILIENI